MEVKKSSWELFDARRLSGRNRRLLHEWKQLELVLSSRREIDYRISRRNGEGLPTEYLIHYAIRSLCGVENIERLNEPGVSNPPLFASDFFMRVTLPPNYPCIDAPVEFRFLTESSDGKPVAHPWHPNIRYFGAFAGRVCLNTPDSYTGMDWCVTRVADYLTYQRYHAVQSPPYPEDFKVAEWVVRQGEPNGWIYFDG